MTGPEAKREAGRLRAARSPWHPNDQLDYVWREVVAIPFSYGLSKNALHGNTRGGGRRLTREARDTTDLLAALVRRAADDQPVVLNRVWLDLYVEKPDMRGDAINMLDFVADAVKVGLDLDDRWYSVAGIEWAINHDDPQIYVGFGQTADWAGQVCVLCGNVENLDDFAVRPSSRTGRAPECAACLALAKTLRRAA